MSDLIISNSRELTPLSKGTGEDQKDEVLVITTQTDFSSPQFISLTSNTSPIGEGFFSIWAKANKNSEFILTLNGVTETFTVTTTWKRYYVQGEVIADNILLLGFLTKNCIYHLYQGQLEAGDKLTDWTSNPTEIEDRLTAAEISIEPEKIRMAVYSVAGLKNYFSLNDTSIITTGSVNHNVFTKYINQSTNFFFYIKNGNSTASISNNLKFYQNSNNTSFPTEELSVNIEDNICYFSVESGKYLIIDFNTDIIPSQIMLGEKVAENGFNYLKNYVSPDSEFHAGSAITITRDEIDLSSPKTVISIPLPSGDGTIAQFNEDGISASRIIADSIESDSVVQRVDVTKSSNTLSFNELTQLINYKMPSENNIYSINADAQNVTIDSVLGGSTITIDGSNNQSNRSLYSLIINNCQSNIILQNFIITCNNSSNEAIVCHNCNLVTIKNCIINGTGTTTGAGIIADNSTISIEETNIENFKNSIVSKNGGKFISKNNTGNCLIAASSGIGFINGTVPTDSSHSDSSPFYDTTSIWGEIYSYNTSSGYTSGGEDPITPKYFLELSNATSFAAKVQNLNTLTAYTEGYDTDTWTLEKYTSVTGLRIGFFANGGTSEATYNSNVVAFGSVIRLSDSKLIDKIIKSIKIPLRRNSGQGLSEYKDNDGKNSDLTLDLFDATYLSANSVERRLQQKTPQFSIDYNGFAWNTSIVAVFSSINMSCDSSGTINLLLMSEDSNWSKGKSYSEHYSNFSIDFSNNKKIEIEYE